MRRDLSDMTNLGTNTTDTMVTTSGGAAVAGLQKPTVTFSESLQACDSRQPLLKLNCTYDAWNKSKTDKYYVISHIREIKTNKQAKPNSKMMKKTGACWRRGRGRWVKAVKGTNFQLQRQSILGVSGTAGRLWLVTLYYVFDRWLLRE